MRSGKANASSGMNTRQRATAIVFVVIVIVLIWQGYGLIKESRSASSVPSAPSASSPQAAPSAPNPSNVTPQAASLSKQEPAAMNPADVVQLQKQKAVEDQYISSLNELQMLRLSREIAETNQAIVKAKLETVTAEKNILELLKPAPVTNASYAQGLVNPAAGGGTPTSQIQAQPEVSYTVISVSELQNKWNAVLGYQGNLYQVSIGDVLPVDGSAVVDIGKEGVILEKSGVRRKISLVPII